MTFIDDPAALGQLAEDLAGQSSIAVDLEADSLHHFPQKVCLVLITIPGRDFIVDTIALRDLSPLGPIFADPAVRKLFHSADYDLRSLYRDFRIEVRGLFDTQIAAQLLGEERIGLSDMLEKHLGFALDKRFQKADWSKRPLSPAMAEYAVEDARHLDRLAALLEAALRDKGRFAWAEEEFSWMEKVRPTEQPDEPMHLRVKGARLLPGRGLAILEELLVWRDGEARRRDVPPFKVVHDGVLLETARTAPAGTQALAGVPGLHRGTAERYGRDLLAAVARGRAVPDDRLPSWPRGPRRRWDPFVETRLRHLKHWRAIEADRLGMQPGILINNALLDEISRTPPATPADLSRLTAMRNWQRRELGEGIVAALAPRHPHHCGETPD